VATWLMLSLLVMYLLSYRTIYDSEARLQAVNKHPTHRSTVVSCDMVSGSAMGQPR
jgi:hypothetical protein